MSKRTVVALILVAALALSVAGILSGCATGTEQTVNQAQQGAIQATRDANLQILNAAIQVYYANTGQYPTSLQQLVGQYIKQIPTDPEGKTYMLVTENGVVKAVVK